MYKIVANQSNTYAIDVMAEGRAHCLYHVGFAKLYPAGCIYLHDSSAIEEAAAAYGEEIANVRYLEKKYLYFRLLTLLMRRKNSVHILGAHLWQIAIFFCLLFLQAIV